MNRPSSAPASDPIRLEPLPPAEDAGGRRIRARLTLDGDAREVWYRAAGGAIGDDLNPFYPIALIVAMAHGRPLRIEGAVSPTLHTGIERIQEIYATWYPRALSRVSVDAAEWMEPGGAGSGVGTFFSGGADSFYTALQNAGELTHLVFVTGLDIRLADAALRARVGPAIRDAAAAMGQTLIEVETNAREVLDAHVSWLYQGYGPALASVALALRPTLRKIYFSSEVTYRSLEGRAGHPLIDRLWRTAGTEVRHYGADIEKPRKYVTLARSPVAMDHLRVCWVNTDGAYNCGQCPKCVRAMAILASLGALPRAKRFPDRLRPIDLWRLAWMPHENEQVRTTIAGVRDVALEHGASGALGLALRSAAHPARGAMSAALHGFLGRLRGAPRRAAYHVRRLRRVYFTQ